MPQVPSTDPISEQSQQQLDNQESLQKSVLDRIQNDPVFKSMDLPEDQVEDRKVSRDNLIRGDEEQVEEEQAQDDFQEEEQEEVIPKSKVQPRFDQMTARIKQLEQEKRELEERTAPVDDIQRQLDAMSETALEDALVSARVAKEESRNDPNRLRELVQLERKIEKTIANAPIRFANNQAKELNRSVERLVSSGDITSANQQKVYDIAKGIYEEYPKLRNQIDGQAMALELAVKHYRELSKTSLIKTDTQNLKGQLNNLKKKTALDTKAIKGGGDKITLDKLRNTAMTGSMKDKERFAQNDPRFKIDAMIPDFLKG